MRREAPLRARGFRYTEMAPAIPSARPSATALPGGQSASALAFHEVHPSANAREPDKYSAAGRTHFGCVETVPKPRELRAPGVCFSEKQIPQVVIFIESGRNR